MNSRYITVVYLVGIICILRLGVKGLKKFGHVLFFCTQLLLISHKFTDTNLKKCLAKGKVTKCPRSHPSPTAWQQFIQIMCVYIKKSALWVHSCCQPQTRQKMRHGITYILELSLWLMSPILTVVTTVHRLQKYSELLINYFWMYHNFGAKWRP